MPFILIIFSSQTQSSLLIDASICSSKFGPKAINVFKPFNPKVYINVDITKNLEPHQIAFFSVFKLLLSVNTECVLQTNVPIQCLQLMTKCFFENLSTFFHANLSLFSKRSRRCYYRCLYSVVKLMFHRN